MDTNIDNYTIDDIYTILNLQDDNPSAYQITDAANNIIAKMKSEGNTTIATFFEQVREKALKETAAAAAADADDADDADEADDITNEKTQLGNWWKNEFPSQQNNPVQTNKYTDRKHRVQIFDADNKNNSHFQMNRERLGINQTYQVPVIQDVLNPNLKNITTRMVCADSQYRQNILPYSVGDPTSPAYNTDYTFNLSEQLKNVISLKLYSVQIPTSWYAFDQASGNICFEYTVTATSITTTYSITPGNYSADQLKTALIALNIPNLTIAIQPYSNLFTFKSTTAASLTFYKENGMSDCSGNNCGLGPRINQNLGWNLGFRQEPRLPPDTNAGNIVIQLPAGTLVTADVQPDTYGPKYFILTVDDYNHNHLNNGLVNIANTSNKLSLPSYYNVSDISCNISPVLLAKSSPRTLTQAQLYSVNEIIINRKQASNRLAGPTTSDVLALIPLRGVTSLRPDPYIEFGPTLQSNERTYFGPVNIDRLRVRLLDDKGNLVNLHDHDWSFTLMVDQQYQY